MSGLERGGSIRMLTLTSAPSSPLDIQSSWRRLRMRLLRRGLCQDYIKVTETTKSGLLHLHLLIRSPYIDVVMLRKMWSEIHGATFVYIKRVTQGARSKRGVSSYLAKYLSKEAAGKLSWSWGWCYKGFCGVWQKAKSNFFRVIPDHLVPVCFPHLLRWWKRHLNVHQEPLSFLEELVWKIDDLKLWGQIQMEPR
jgi:hypothetical protein